MALAVRGPPARGCGRDARAPSGWGARGDHPHRRAGLVRYAVLRPACCGRDARAPRRAVTRAAIIRTDGRVSCGTRASGPPVRAGRPRTQEGGDASGDHPQRRAGAARHAGLRPACAGGDARVPRRVVRGAADAAYPAPHRDGVTLVRYAGLLARLRGRGRPRIPAGREGSRLAAYPAAPRRVSTCTVRGPPARLCGRGRPRTQAGREGSRLPRTRHRTATGDTCAVRGPPARLCGRGRPRAPAGREGSGRAAYPAAPRRAGTCTVRRASGPPLRAGTPAYPARREGSGRAAHPPPHFVRRRLVRYAGLRPACAGGTPAHPGGR